MAISLLKTGPLFKRLAPAVVATMVFGFAAEANALRQEHRQEHRGGGDRNGKDRSWRNGDRSHVDRGHVNRGHADRDHRHWNKRRGDHRRWSGRHRGNSSSVVIYRGPSYYEPRYGYGYRYGYNTRYRSRHTAPRYRSYGRGYGYRNYSRYGRYGSGFGFGFSARGGDAVAIVGLTALTLAVLQSANETQRYAHERALNRAATAPVGDPIIWNEHNGSGRITVTRTGTLPSTGQPCREFTQEVTIDGQQETAYGTACRQPDGAWQLVQ